MNKIRIYLFIILTGTPLMFAQPGTDVVVAAAVEKGNKISLKSLVQTIKDAEILTKISQSIGEIEKAQKFNSYLKDLQTVAKIYDLIQRAACAHKKLEAMMNLMSGISYDDCFVSFKYEVAIAKFSYSLEMLDIVLSGLSQTTGERNASLKDVIDNIHQSTMEIGKLTRTLERAIRVNLNERLDNFVNSTIYNPYSPEREYTDFNI